jgi:hypothetical protein
MACLESQSNLEKYIPCFWLGTCGLLSTNCITFHSCIPLIWCVQHLLRPLPFQYRRKRETLNDGMGHKFRPLPPYLRLAFHLTAVCNSYHRPTKAANIGCLQPLSRSKALAKAGANGLDECRSAVRRRKSRPNI